MTDRLGAMPLDQLEVELSDLATAIVFPPTPNLANAVALRLRESGETIEERPREFGVRRVLRRSLLLAAALVLVVVGAALAVRFGLELLSIERAPVPTAPFMSPSSFPAGAPGMGLGLGEPMTLGAIHDAATFDVLLPEALGPPDATFVGGESLRGQVAFVYAPREDLPASGLLGGAALLITQNLGTADDGLAHKIADTSSATVAPVEVDGAPGVWITGEPHVFWYVAPDGTFIQESQRLVGDTLAWERDGVLYRIEGAIPLDRAMDIARSMSPDARLRQR